MLFSYYELLDLYGLFENLNIVFNAQFFYFYTELIHQIKATQFWHVRIYRGIINNLSAFVIKMQIIAPCFYSDHQFLCFSILKVVRYFAKNNHNSDFFPKKDGYSPFGSPWFSLGIYKPAWKKIPELNAKFVGRLLEPAFVK